MIPSRPKDCSKKDRAARRALVYKIASMLDRECSILFWEDPALLPRGVVLTHKCEKYGEHSMTWPTAEAFLFGDGWNLSVFDTFSPKRAFGGPWSDRIARRNKWVAFVAGASSPEELELRLAMLDGRKGS